MMIETPPPRAFAVWFQDLRRWDPNSFHDISWHWPRNVMKPLGSVLTPRKEKVDRKAFEFRDLQPITLHFDGSMDKRQVEAHRAYTMDLYFARPGDIVVAKIDLKNGAVGIVPDDWRNAVVTGHFAVYEPDRSRLVPEYLHRIIQSRFFKAHLWRNKVGAEGRKEVKLNFFEAQEIPLPPMDIQRAIVSRWQQAQEEIATERASLTQAEEAIPQQVLAELGIPLQKVSALNKAFALPWQDMERWSVGYLKKGLTGSGGFTTSRYPVVPLSDCLVSTTNGYCIRPVMRETPHKMLKLNALTPAGLDLMQTKYVEVDDKTATRFSLRQGDLLICRSVGSYDHIAKCALVEQDSPDVLFPDIIIRARFNGQV